MALKDMKLQDNVVFQFILSIRLTSVVLVQTFYVPDEYWQSLEVAHKLVFGYGYLTWEWSQGIRSYIHPLIISLVYKIVQLLGIDYAEVLIYLPQILQGILSAYADFCFYKWTLRKRWSIFVILTSFFWYYTATRTLLNTFETALTTIALSKYPWIGRGNYECKTFITLVALNCIIRPTAAILWIPLCAYHFLSFKDNRWNLLLRRYLPIGLLVLTFGTLVDSLSHGSFLVSSYEFFKINLIDSIGEHYGSQPWHWYLSQGLPAILGVHIVSFTLACINVIRTRRNCPNELALLFCIIFTITIYSFIPHKEFRFILPLLPIALHLSAMYLSKWSVNTKNYMIWVVTIAIFVANIVPAWYVGIVHQRGTLDVMEPLRQIAIKDPNDSNFLFLTPCHSTPLYSHLHVNVTTRFLTCEPNLQKLDNYVDEADLFYNAPNAWFRKNYPANGTQPSHIVLFNSLEPSLSDILSRYKPIKRIFHTSFPTDRVGRYVMLYQRVDIK